MEQTAVYIALAVLAVLAGILGLAVFLLLRRGGTADREAGGQSSLAVELAVEKERSGRVFALEQELGEVRTARGQADLEVASLREAKTRLETELSKSGAEVDRVTTALNTATQGSSALKVELAGAREAKAHLETENSKSTAETERVKAALEVATRESSGLKSDLAVVRETLEQERLQGAEKLKLLTEAKETMTKEFQVLANDVMSRHGETFSKQNKDQIDVLLTPLRDKLKEFQEGLQKAHEDTGKERATLAEQIRSLSEQSARMSSETVNLTRALKGSAQMQGAWGEMILETLLEKSGLREREEYFRQTTHSTEDGGRVRTDVIVNLPGGQHVIIDSKVSMVAFEGYVNAISDEERAQNLAAHLASIRGHIRSLAAKEYQVASGGGLDYVILFIPIEGALALALQQDPNLTSFAVQNSVAIATPTTLMIALRTIENVWKVERRNQNAEAIADRAGLLYGKFVGFVEDMQGIGRRLNQAQTTYTAAMGKLQNGTGNLIGQAEKLKELGAKTTRTMPRGLLADDGAPDGPAALLVEGPEASDADGAQEG